MLIIAIGYFYVIGMVAIVAMLSGHFISGFFTLFFAGILPGFLWLSTLSKARRASRDRALQEPIKADVDEDDGKTGNSTPADIPSSRH
ncbi:hypothetical protein [Chitinimonas sp. BJB300]|uniref:hypothetical protein n=1 Tax=Chitinimonas sp. BJB300 TaxID=1559339 RepID=UPI000C0D0973|nr:hypothetical protein [Chitinimonas sp. BJB300]PHV11078.1 hypothetical protein CSQ89_12665 [Chitinimonas sp. BJB300]TSJ89705.1 hypothetical protein FG002_005655 [Chitinimonas sp. BJB300]